jgi:hypothetical protein
VITRVAALRPRELRPALRAVRSRTERRFAPTCPGATGALSGCPEPCPSRPECAYPLASSRTCEASHSRINWVMLLYRASNIGA